MLRKFKNEFHFDEAKNKYKEANNLVIFVPGEYQHVVIGGIGSIFLKLIIVKYTVLFILFNKIIDLILLLNIYNLYYMSNWNNTMGLFRHPIVLKTKVSGSCLDPSSYWRKSCLWVI